MDRLPGMLEEEAKALAAALATAIAHVATRIAASTIAAMSMFAMWGGAVWCPRHHLVLLVALPLFHYLPLLRRPPDLHHFPPGLFLLRPLHLLGAGFYRKTDRRLPAPVEC